MSLCHAVIDVCVSPRGRWAIAVAISNSTSSNDNTATTIDKQRSNNSSNSTMNYDNSAYAHQVTPGVARVVAEYAAPVKPPLPAVTQVRKSHRKGGPPM